MPWDETNNSALRRMNALPRPASSLVSFWAVAGFATLLLGDALVRRDWHVFSISIAPGALVVWAAWLILYRPSIYFDRTRLVTINPGRIIEVPWSQVVAVRQRPQLYLELDDGARVTCWASPFPEKPGRRRASEASNDPVRDVVATLEAARDGAPAAPDDARVLRRWDATPLAVGGVLTLACAVELVTTLTR